MKISFFILKNVWYADSNKKKYYDVKPARIEKIWVHLLETANWENAKKIFVIFKEMLAFRKGVFRNLENYSEERKHQKEIFTIFRRANDRLFSHVFISSFVVRKKTHILQVKKGLNPTYSRHTLIISEKPH